MRVVVVVLETIAALVPNFQTLGLLVATFFSVYRCAIALGLPGTTEVTANLLLSLLVGYVASVTLNLEEFPQAPFWGPRYLA